MDIKLRAWKMYFDGAMNQSHVPLAVKLNFEATNNMVEYEACIARMDALKELRVKEVEVFGDSTSVIPQAQKLWKVKEEHLKPY